MNKALTIKEIITYCLIVVMGFVIIKPQSFLFSDPDTFWHIELGRWMIQHHQIVREGIDSFAGSHLPYIPHEYGFQLIIGALYMWLGWRGLVVLSVLSILLLMTGLYALVRIAREEEGSKDIPVLVHYFVLLLGMYMIATHFALRPQMISDGLVVWFLVFLCKFRMDSNWRNLLWMGIVSLALANIHAGVYPLIPVFFGFALVEAIVKKRFSKWYCIALIVLLITSVLNPGGLSTVTYIHANGDSNNIITEWQPINISQQPVLFVQIILFLWTVYKGSSKNLFRNLLAIGILYLGIVNYKEHMYLILFTTYYFACAVDTLPVKMLKPLTHSKYSWMNTQKYLIVLFYSMGLVAYLLVGLFSGQPNYNPQYPVKEANWISSHTTEQRPNVLADYGVSGYLMFRGMNIFVDGREDPFTSPQSKSGRYNWTAFQQAQYAIIPQVFEDIIKTHKPDYVILKKTVKNSYVDLQMQPIRAILGKPVYSGDYGDVYDAGICGQTTDNF